MAMTGIEKRFVNRERKAQRNKDMVELWFEQLDVNKIHDVLELGCGIGAVSAYLSKEYNMNVYGSDFDPEQIQIARKMYPEIDCLYFGIEDGTNLSCKDESFDLILSANVFHHIPAWEYAIQEVTRTLRPQGYFIWADLAFPKIIKQVFQPLIKSYGLYTIEDIRTAFSKSGLKELNYERIAHGPFTHHQALLQRNY